MTNVFWIGANILFDLQTGETKQVYQFVFREEDATTLTKDQASVTRSFVESRAGQFVTNIVWSIERSVLRPGLFVVKGEQHV